MSLRQCNPRPIRVPLRSALSALKPARPLSTTRGLVVDLVVCACVTQYIGGCCCCKTPSQVRVPRPRAVPTLDPVSKLEERRVGADGDGMPSSAASPRDHRRRPQARPGRGRTSVREAVDAGRRSAERRPPESELAPVCHELWSRRTRWHTGAGLGRSARRRTRRPCACRHPRQLLERRQPVVATLAASVFSGRRRDRCLPVAVVTDGTR